MSAVREARITLPTSGDVVTFRPALRRCWHRKGDGLTGESTDLNGIGWEACMSEEDRAACDALMRRTFTEITTSPLDGNECLFTYIQITQRVHLAHDIFTGCGSLNRPTAERSFLEAVGAGRG